MIRVYALACLLVMVTCESHDLKNYTDHFLVSARAVTPEHLEVLKNLEKDYDQLVFLSGPAINITTSMIVPPDVYDDLITKILEAQMTVSAEISDIQEVIDGEIEENNAKKRRRSQFDGFQYDVYRQTAEVKEVMLQWEYYYPDLVRVKKLDHQTHEGRDVYYVEVGTEKDSNDNDKKPVIFIESLTHAREWITTAALLYAVDTMLQNSNTTYEDTLTKFTFVVIPVVNPDGYERTWNGDRFWRKNRRPLSNAGCTGVDLNRNYDIKFGTVGVSSNCTKSIYPGESAFSEAETQNIKDLFLQLKERVVSFLSVHAFSQLLLLPWSYVESAEPTEVPDNIQQLKDAGEDMIEALGTNGMEYRMGNAFQLVGYAASGGSIDWALAEKPGIYSYCFELRPQSATNVTGFIVPTSQIIPTGQELLKGFDALITHL